MKAQKPLKDSGGVEKGFQKFPAVLQNTLHFLGNRAATLNT